MSNARRQILLNVFKLWDIGLMLLAFFVATVAVLAKSHTMTLSEFFSMRVKIENFLIFSLFLLAWHFLFKGFGLYDSRRLANKRSEVVDVATASTVATLIIGGASVLIHIRMATPRFLVVFWLVGTVSAVSSRILLRVVLAYVRRHGRNLRDVLIVGTNNRAMAFARKLHESPQLGYRVIGFVDQPWAGTDQLQLSGFALACDFEGAQEFLRSNVVDEVVMALPMRSFHYESSKIASFCEEQGITVRLLSNIFDLKLAHSSAEDLEGDPLITHRTGAVDELALMAKRTLDIVASGAMILLLSPVLLVAVILIMATSAGPALFVQKRLGLNKRRFNIYKFRTMVVDAEKKMREIEHLNEVSGPVFKIKNDPRITAVGRFLRRTSIDELPQLFNVFRGDMSLVGPRPLPVRDYEGFSEDWQRRRFSVRPGITCLWQVKGRSSIPFEQWMELDLQYIDKWSLWLDLRILLQTIPAVLRGSGAA
jgi:exopolysaccharide biosynthesis polyprenyl glycosylphosphotransferase